MNGSIRVRHIALYGQLKHFDDTLILADFNQVASICLFSVVLHERIQMNLTNDTICKTISCLMMVNYEMTQSVLCPVQVGLDLFNSLSYLQTISEKRHA